MLDRYAIVNCLVAVLITPMKRSPCVQNSPAAVTDAKYESMQTIMSVLAYGITTSFSTFVLLGIFFVILLIFLIFCRLHNPDPYHNPWLPLCQILDLHPIIRIPVHFPINPQTQIDPMTTLSVPPKYGLISTYEIRRIEELCAMLIKTSNKVLNEFPLMSFMTCTLIL